MTKYLLMIWWILVLLPSMVSAQCVVTNITDFYLGSLTDAGTPLIDGDEIVFRGFEGIFSSSGLYHYKNDTVTLVPGDRLRYTVDFHNGEISYLTIGTNLHFEVYTYANETLSTITQQALLSGTLDPIKIHNGDIVWSGDVVIEAGPPYASNIFLYENGQTRQLTFVTNSRESQVEPVISDDYVVWAGGNDATSSQIHALDRNTGNIRIISQEFGNVTSLNGNPQVSNDIITWTSLNDFVWYIHRYTGDTSEVIAQLGLLTGDPQIDNGEIVYSALANNGRSEIFHYKNGITTNLSFELPGIGHRWPKISEGRVVWLSADEDDNLKLYYWAGDAADAIEISQLAPNSSIGTFGMDDKPTLYDISRNQIVWEAKSTINGSPQIYRAICDSECPQELNLTGTIDNVGVNTPYAARELINTNQVILNGELSLSAPDVQLNEGFTITSNGLLEIDNIGCNTNE